MEGYASIGLKSSLEVDYLENKDIQLPELYLKYFSIVYESEKETA